MKRKTRSTDCNCWWFEKIGALNDPVILWRGAEPRWHWWREALPRMSREYARFAWKDGYERAAFAYELARRTCKKLLRLPTYPELTRGERESLKRVAGVSDARWVAKQYSPGSPHGDVNGYATCPLFWNLRETDTAICNVFRRWLDNEREKAGIARRKARPNKSRPVPWNWLEILDAESGLTDTERSTKTKAVRLALQFAEQLAPVLKDISPRK